MGDGIGILLGNGVKQKQFQRLGIRKIVQALRQEPLFQPFPVTFVYGCFGHSFTSNKIALAIFVESRYNEDTRRIPPGKKSGFLHMLQTHEGGPKWKKIEIYSACWIYSFALGSVSRIIRFSTSTPPLRGCPSLPERTYALCWPPGRKNTRIFREDVCPLP